MSGVILAVKTFFQAYGRALVLALLLHILLLTVLLQTRFTPVAKPLVAEAIESYLYQPPPSSQALLSPLPESQISADTEAAAVIIVPDVVATPAQATPSSNAIVAEQLADTLSDETRQPAALTATTPQQSLAQRALNRAATVDPVRIEQTAAASYQQFLQAQQQPKMTVDKRHQQLSSDPAQQVVAKFDDGSQLIRTKGGCRFSDSSKAGFEALMAASAVVPCGDEEKPSALLKQALEKHIKR